MTGLLSMSPESAQGDTWADTANAPTGTVVGSSASAQGSFRGRGTEEGAREGGRVSVGGERNLQRGEEPSRPSSVSSLTFFSLIPSRKGPNREGAGRGAQSSSSFPVGDTAADQEGIIADLWTAPEVGIHPKTLTRLGISPQSRVIIRKALSRAQSENEQKKEPQGSVEDSATMPLSLAAFCDSESGLQPQQMAVSPFVLEQLNARPGDVATLEPLLESSLNVCGDLTLSFDEQREGGPGGSSQIDKLRPQASTVLAYVRSCLLGSLLFEGNSFRIRLLGLTLSFIVQSVGGGEGVSGQSSILQVTQGGEGRLQGHKGPWRVLSSTRVGIMWPGDEQREKRGAEERETPNVTESESVKNLEGAQPALKGFERLGGMRTAIDELRVALKLPIERWEACRELGVKPPKGILLYGPPGTGKSMLARALAEEVQCEFVSAAASELISKFVGETEERVRALFRKCASLASRKGPEAQTVPSSSSSGAASSSTVTASSRGRGCVLFLDEIDALCPKRDSDDVGEAERRVVSAFLTLMDGEQIEGSERVVVVGATNRPTAIDEALRRAGRFEREIEIGVPSREDRREILHVHLGAMPHGLSETDIEEIVDRTNAFVGADVAALCRAAALRALERHAALDWGLRVVQEREERGVSGGVREVEGEQGGREESSSANMPAGSQCQVKSVKERLRVEVEDVRNALLSVRPSAMKELRVEVPAVRWTDIGGYEELKAQLVECVEWPLKYEQAFKALRLTPPRGLLLYGPPGCSKTMMARAVATESRMNFTAIKGPELFSKWVGESERAIRELFRRARQNAPCVVFFDEIDAVGVDREQQGDAGGVGARVLSQLLNEMDGVSSVRQVVVIGATNRPDLLDAALLRPGRFDRLLYVGLPDLKARAQILRGKLGGVPMDTEDVLERLREEEGGSSGLGEENSGGEKGLVAVCAEIAKRTEGLSGAEVCMVCSEASSSALRDSIRERRAGGRRMTDGETPSDDSKEAVAVVPVSGEHMLSALRKVKPRIAPSLIAFYKDFASKHGEAPKSA
uniref:AAA+ ATPase domain-containing protein n=1 Tax=Chromera velia CCMP2878 TaxID=1169474 RepID=A0A0G4GVV1_9ALVE|eukprot:Cvel_23528.t1-p1 / transcript=Cvel_23528.t1 / gene=Cvel_23528 / organism=Chromera_velia_CCMP2878 / gene_product=Cell division cycle protein 48 homolog AF_1297, putative / transcript_product=Cell division cycle protein 48 homolog AF_1297, putative / location=Cvel_scaffold2435:1181-10179(-) / protein_length=1034 / sequence_SO=supercontig / SO=protein_coding / is_pseudo=false